MNYNEHYCSGIKGNGSTGVISLFSNALLVSSIHLAIQWVFSTDRFNGEAARSLSYLGFWNPLLESPFEALSLGVDTLVLLWVILGKFNGFLPLVDRREYLENDSLPRRKEVWTFISSLEVPLLWGLSIWKVVSLGTTAIVFGLSSA